jgi:hypothetical protein
MLQTCGGMKMFLLAVATIGFVGCENSGTVKVNLDSTVTEIKNSKALDSISEKGSRILDSVKRAGSEVWDSSKAKGGRLVDKADKEMNDLKRKDSVR